jgi:hypothetical protein
MSLGGLCALRSLLKRTRIVKVICSNPFQQAGSVNQPARASYHTCISKEDRKLALTRVQKHRSKRKIRSGEFLLF